MTEYLNNIEVESAIANLAAAYPSLCSLIELPNETFELATTHALRISSAPAGTLDAVVIIGAVHAREWGSCEILVNLATDLLSAYTSNAGLAYGDVSFSASTVAQLIDQRELVLFPLVNPDGRAYSMVKDQHNPEGWRKNRNPESAQGNEAKIGVDINRNYDFLWDFATKFDPAAFGLNLASADPAVETFHGKHAFSEPETRNVQWLVDQFPRTRWFVDLHSYEQLFLYSWGDDVDQSTDPTQNFQNPAFDGKRGTPSSSSYGEYMPEADQATAAALATAAVDTINAVRGGKYLAEQSFSLYGVSGGSDDYMYSRNWIDPALEKIYGFTVEWGTTFHPPWEEMARIVKDITAGLIEFCSATFVTRAVTFEVDRDHYGQDEIDALRAQPGGAVVKGAFWVVLDGFTPRELGITGSGSTAIAPPVTFTPASGVSAACTSIDSSDPAFSPDAFQRLRFAYDVSFGGDDSAFTSFAGQQQTVDLTTSFQEIGASAQVTFMKQPDPYIEQGAQIWWLSSDIHLLQVAEGDERFGVTMGTDPEAFLLEVTAALEAGTAGVQGLAGGESFDADTSEQSEALTIAPYVARASGLIPVYNFAIARVHYRGESEPAEDVRVFFRLFSTNSTHTSFEPNTYARSPAAYPIPAADWGQHVTPTPGVEAGEYVTIPCFARRRRSASQQGAPNSLPAQQYDELNVKSLPATGGPLRDYFYGCFLDINQPTEVLPSGGVVPAGNANGPWPAGSGVSLEPVSAAFIRNEHQCLMAEIAFDPVPIAAGTQPWNSDKLAQRNLSWSTVANPGIDVSRQALETFEVRPTPATVGPGEPPDELMIDWSGVPAGEQVEIYLPAVDADAVLAQAGQLYPSKKALTRVDAHTIGCRTGGITYIPLPAASGDGGDFAGLMSIGMPRGIKRGELHQVVVRQLTNASARVKGAQPDKGGSAHSGVRTLRWRRVLGTFQINIPVSTKELMLKDEELRFSIFQWIGKSILPASRWHPVFERYLGLLGVRVGELGGDPERIKPSRDGYSGLPDGKRADEGSGAHKTGGAKNWSEHAGLTGKVSGLTYDHFGDFDGFILELMDGRPRRFHSREAEIEALAREAWRERILTTVIPQAHDDRGVRAVILRA